MSGAERFRIAETSTWRELDGQVVVLEGISAAYFSIEGSGGRLWKRLSDGATTEDLVSELVDEFGIPAEQAATDVSEFLESCRSSKLIEKSD
jgi:hypothetical protein